MIELAGNNYQTAKDDPEFCAIADKLAKDCPHLHKHYVCERCPEFSRCERLFHGLCNLSYKHKLRPDEVSKYRQRFRQLIGVAI